MAWTEHNDLALPLGATTTLSWATYRRTLGDDVIVTALRHAKKLTPR